MTGIRIDGTTIAMATVHVFVSLFAFLYVRFTVNSVPFIDATCGETFLQRMKIVEPFIAVNFGTTLAFAVTLAASRGNGITKHMISAYKTMLLFSIGGWATTSAAPLSLCDNETSGVLFALVIVQLIVFVLAQSSGASMFK